MKLRSEQLACLLGLLMFLGEQKGVRARGKKEPRHQQAAIGQFRDGIVHELPDQKKKKKRLGNARVKARYTEDDGSM